MADHIDRYLHLLGLRRKEPDLRALEEIVHAHVVTIPFENISKLYYLRTAGLRGIVGIGQYLDGIERFHFGGTCYANNVHLNTLLTSLGYDAHLCGADMSKPDVHLVNLVHIDGREFIVDAGNAAPFFSPLPRDLTVEHRITHGNDSYVLLPQDPEGRSRMMQYRNGLPRHGYVVKPGPRKISEFERVIGDSFLPGAVFMNSVLLVGFHGGTSHVIHNLHVVEYEGPTAIKRQPGSIDALVDEIERIFSIPAGISRIALEGVSLEQDAWS
jgi:arylamine N-acetyltransferase